MIVALATGSGRCGTQTFGAQMQRLRGFVGVHEGRQQVLLRAKGIPSAANLVCGSDDAREWNINALEQRRKMFVREGKVGYGEAAHYFGLNLDLVEEVFPEARIVHLVREPLSMVWSMMQFAGRKIYHCEGKHPRTKHMWAQWGDCYPLYPGVTNRAEGFATYWQSVNKAIERTSLPSLLVRTEDLKEGETWRKILDFIGVEDQTVKAPEMVFNARRPQHHRIARPEYVDEAVERICTWKPKAE
jgi:hypothetical protein